MQNMWTLQVITNLYLLLIGRNRSEREELVFEDLEKGREKRKRFVNEKEDEFEEMRMRGGGRGLRSHRQCRSRCRRWSRCD